MKFLKLDKKKGAGGPSIKSRYAYLIYIDDIDYLPSTDDKGVRMEGDIVLKEDCKMMPLYLTSSSQEFSYDILGDDDEKSYLVKFSGTHPGTELEALEFAKNMIEQPFLVLIPSCNETEPWKLLGELTNPLIFTSSHKAGKDGSKFTFNFEQRIGSEFIYFSYGGVEVPSGGEGTDPPSGGFDPTKWARIDASNIDEHITAWRTKLGVHIQDQVLTIGPITADSNKVYLALSDEGKNEVVINGNNYLTTVPQEFPFTPVTTGIKVLIIYAKDDSQIFYLSEGIEAPEAVEPKYDGLFIARLIVSTTGVLVETGNSTFKQKQESDWRYVNITDVSEPIKLALPFDTRGSFYLTKSPGVGIPTIAGIKKTSIAFAGDQYFYGGREGLIFNDTGGDVILNAVGVVDNSVFLISNRITPFTLKNNSAVKWKLRESVIELLPSGSDPDLSGYATTTQLATKLDKPTTDGTWVVTRTAGVSGYTDASTLGKNIFNANLVLTTDRSQNLGGYKLSFTNGRFSVSALEMEVKSSYAVANSLWFDGVALWLNPTVGASRRFNAGTIFNYTPTGNFTLSEVKNAMEAAGYNFNDGMVTIILGTNNYTCSIDIGSANICKDIYFKRMGTGTISFSSTRTLNSGIDLITILNGNEGSMAKITFGTSQDILTIRNL